MPRPIELPELGTAGEPAVLAVWLVDASDRVSRGDRVAEVVVSGVVFEVRAPADGRLQRLAVRADDVIPEGGVLAWFEPDDPGEVSGGAA